MRPKPSETPRPELGPRYVALDSLRGLAAVAVVFYHVFMDWLHIPTTRAPGATRLQVLFHDTPLRLLMDGYACVALFFVLSGFVLALGYTRDRRPAYGPYLVRRFCRIYIPYIVAVTVALGFKSILPNGPVGWVGDWAKQPTTARSILHQVAMVTSVDQRYDPATWSLTHEMRASLVFPLLMVPVLALPAWLAVGLPVGLIYLGMTTFNALKLRGVPSEFGIGESIYFLGMFAAGAIVARYRHPLIARFKRMGAWTSGATGIAGLLALAYYSKVNGHLGPIPLPLIVVTAGSVALILSALTGPRLIRLLESRPLAFLGRISYSIYLYHMIVYLAFGNSTKHLCANWVVKLVTMAAIIPVAAVAYRAVELPAIRLGRWLTNREQAEDRSARLTIRTAA